MHATDARTLCLSTGEYTYQLEPSNTYVLRNTRPAWKVISLLLEIGRSKVDQIWAEARTKY